MNWKKKSLATEDEYLEYTNKWKCKHLESMTHA